jgi:hypothetical protein
VQDGEWRAIMFVLTVLGKKRGYRDSWRQDPLYLDPLDPDYVEPGPRRRRIDDLDDEDWPEPTPEVDWPAREADLIACFQEERQGLLGRIRELEAATPPPPADDGDDAEVMAEIARLTRIADDLQRRVNGAP